MKNLKFVVFAIASLVLISCASQKAKEQDIDRRASQEVSLGLPGESAAYGRDAIENSKVLSPLQKKQMVDILNKTFAESQAIKTQTGQLKATLFKSIASGKFESQDVGIIKSKLRKLEEQKMDIMFKSLDDVKKVIGVEPMAEMDIEFNRLYREF